MNAIKTIKLLQFFSADNLCNYTRRESEKYAAKCQENVRKYSLWNAFLQDGIALIMDV